MKSLLYIDNALSQQDEIQQAAEKIGLKFLHAATLEKAKEIIAKEPPQLIVCEVDLVDGDGISFCIEIRKNKDFNNTGIVLTSVKTDAYIQVMAFEGGADEYFLKPLNKRLFSARLKSLLRRIDNSVNPSRKNELVINREKFLIEYKGKEITLPRKEFEILSLLYHHRGMVFNRDRIKEEIWLNKGKGVNSRTVDVHIKNIREIIGPKFIKTVKGVGYKYAS